MTLGTMIYFRKIAKAKYLAQLDVFGVFIIKFIHSKIASVYYSLSFLCNFRCYLVFLLCVKFV